MEKLGRLLTAMVTPFNIGKPRLPLTEPDEKTASIIRDTLKNYKIDLVV
ncbi:hypothetical protein ES703_51908 [subsurface metagenome]